VNKSFIEFVEKNSLYYFNEKENAFWIVTDIIHDAHDPMSGTSVQVATFLDLEGYYRQWAEDQGYIIEATLYRSWGEYHGIYKTVKDDSCFTTVIKCKSYEKAFMAALNKVMKLVEKQSE